MLVVQLLSAAAFTPPQQFERWSHFKFAVPHIKGDAINSAAVAAGSCWINGYYGTEFWCSPARTAQVIDALGDLADNALASPSNFTLSASKALASPCKENETISSRHESSNFTLASYSAAMQNWYHALCAPADDPTWAANGYDPAYQPQQQALTAGFLCIGTYDVNGKGLPDAAQMAGVINAPTASRDAVCATFPWKAGGSSATKFSRAKSMAELAALAAPLLHHPCGYTGTHDDAV